MRLVMAVSFDGYVARNDSDDMSWLGPTDKRVFRILTGVGGLCAVGKKTYEHMPAALNGRTLVRLSREDFSLHQLNTIHHAVWLLGGQTVALQAFKFGMIREVHLCRSRRSLGEDGVREQLSQYLAEPAMKTRVNDVTVEVYRGNGIRRQPLDMVQD